MDKKVIHVESANIHNLKNITVEIPKYKLTVITGVSGSGKSSLAFDTIYNEGKRRYLMFSGLQTDLHPPFKSITGLSPTIALEQRVINQTNLRSTVGSKSQIGNALSLLYAQYGEFRGAYKPYEKISAEHFNKNTTKGMCLKCLGKGNYDFIDAELFLTPDTMVMTELLDGHIIRKKEYRKQLDAFCKHYSLSTDMEIGKLTEEQKTVLVKGAPDLSFDGLEWYFNDLTGNSIFSSNRRHGDVFNHYSKKVICDKCGGYGIGEIALDTFIDNMNIGQMSALSIKELITFFQSSQLSQNNLVVQDIVNKLKYMDSVGLSYLSLSRSLPTLSGGELQRLFLVSYIITELDSLVFIFDEPTIGLHETEKQNLINTIKDLTLRGNTVIVVEHDESFMKAADYIIDIGPGAGIHGGKLIYQGDYSNFLRCEKSLTACYLANKVCRMKQKYRSIEKNKKITLCNVNKNNIQGLDVNIPLGVLVGIAGRSGSGKSSLIVDTLVPLLRNHLKNHMVGEDEDEVIIVPNTTEIKGVEQLKRCVIVDQKPIGRKSTSTPVSYLGVFDRIRNLYSDLPLAKDRAYEPGMFSTNSSGRCENCSGEGSLYYDIGLGNVMEVKCLECEGTGYISEVLEVRRKDKSIYDVLQMTFSEALDFFQEDKYLRKMFYTMEKVGMGYIRLGQKTKTISGGEAQRIKLAKELGKNIQNALFILDEPTTGLSFSDIDKLMAVLNDLVDKGNSVIVIEHDISVLQRCDYIIEMGPSGGVNGGKLIAEGTVEAICRNPASQIAKYLANDSNILS